MKKKKRENKIEIIKIQFGAFWMFDAWNLLFSAIIFVSRFCIQTSNEFPEKKKQPSSQLFLSYSLKPFSSTCWKSPRESMFPAFVPHWPQNLFTLWIVLFPSNAYHTWSPFFSYHMFKFNFEPSNTLSWQSIGTNRRHGSACLIIVYFLNRVARKILAKSYSNSNLKNLLFIADMNRATASSWINEKWNWKVYVILP